MNSFKKVCYVGKVLREDGKKRKMFVELDFKNNGEKHRLSVTGVIGPRENGNCWGNCGQIDKEVYNIVETNTAEGWNLGKILKLKQIWDLYHLNDMHPGTESQETAIRAKFEKYPDYKTCCAYLEEIGLYNDNGYKYGSSWLYQPIPEEILEWLDNLPDDTAIYPWKNA